jgi:hypothetical protein
MVDESLVLLVRDCLDEALCMYPDVRRAYLEDVEVHEGFERVAEVLVTVIAVMQHEGIDALAARRVMQGTWQVAIASTLRALAARGLPLP